MCAAAKNAKPPKSASRLPVTIPVRWTLAWLAYSASAPIVARTVAQLSVDAALTLRHGEFCPW
jgi:site-specific recombinase XerC